MKLRRGTTIKMAVIAFAGRWLSTKPYLQSTRATVKPDLCWQHIRSVHITNMSSEGEETGISTSTRWQTRESNFALGCTI